jgi:predicted Fe-Mo cluster-binding NifX family protein
MKIALPTNNRNIDSHFGHCEYFTVFTLNDSKEITSEEIIKSPVGCGCKSNIASTLSEIGVKVMLAGNMGEGAVQVLKSNGIDVVRGCSGDVKEAATRWLKGDIKDSGKGCETHDHENCSH